MQQLGSDMVEIQKVPGGWEEAKQMQKLQKEQLLKDVDDEYRWLQCNADARKTRAIQPTRADGRSNQVKEDKRYGGPRAVQVMHEI